jgi:hypothetical protein
MHQTQFQMQENDPNVTNNLVPNLSNSQITQWFLSPFVVQAKQELGVGKGGECET